MGILVLTCAILTCLPLGSFAGSELDSGQRCANKTIYQTRFDNVTWNNDDWQLATTSLDQGHFQSRMTVANGYHGISVAALGPFFEYDVPQDGDDISGWPLFSRRQTFATVGNFWTSQPRTNGTNFPWLYQYGWDSAIAGIPHWAGIVVDLGNSLVLNASTPASSISGFSSTLDMKRGLMSWNFTWSPSDTTAYDISYQMFAHKVKINQAYVRMSIVSHTDNNATVVNVLNGDCAVRTNTTSKGLDDSWIYTAVSPWGLQNVSAYVYAGLSVSGAPITAGHSYWQAPYVGNNESSIASAVDLELKAGQSVSIVKFVGVASSDGFLSPQVVAKNAAVAAQACGFDAALEEHSAEWAAVFPAASVDSFMFPGNGSLPEDSYIIETAITAVANPYQILQNTISRNASLAVSSASINTHSVSVGGLGSDSYAGQVFWDADVWMHPGIAATFPFAASGITNYRKKLYPQAMANAQTAYQSSKNDTTFSSEAAIYAWTSGRFGNCTGTGPCFDYQYHLNGDIVIAMMNQWLASGDTDFLHNDLYPITQSVATLYSELLEANGSYWALTNMTDPDEYANQVDNGGYTMSLIAQTLQTANKLRAFLGQQPNATWASQAQNVLIGKDEQANIVLEYTGPIAMNGSITVKQADIVLIPYPLGYFNENSTAADAVSNLDYYANKQSPDGPGMTYAIFSIVASEVSQSGCSAYTYQQYSYQPYVRAPWFQFSEQLIDDASKNGGTHPAFPFLTGSGGANQVVLYGYLGLRYIDDDHLHVDPAPPPQIPYIQYRTFYWQGWPIKAESNQTHTTITRAVDWDSASGTILNDQYSNASIPVLVGSPADSENEVLYQLSPYGTIVVPNRQYWLNQTIPGNIAQCQPIVSTTSDFVPGQFPIGAVDGATSTRWQPMYANKTSSITVQLPLGLRVAGFEFDWGSQPPYNYSVVFHNTTSASAMSATTVSSSSEVSISRPYDAAMALTIMTVVDNTTTIYFNDTASNSSSPYTASYATLSIWGNQVNGSLTAANMSGQGATVAEWAIIVDDSGAYGNGQRFDTAKRATSNANRMKTSQFSSNMLKKAQRAADDRH